MKYRNFLYDAYIDSTLHHDWNVAFNPKLCDELENRGLKVYLPQRDTDQDNRDKTFEQNEKGMKNSRFLIAVAKNESPNWGVEVGFMEGLGKRIIVLTEKDHEIPLMAKHMSDHILKVEDMSEVNSYIDKLIELIEDK